MPGHGVATSLWAVLTPGEVRPGLLPSPDSLRRLAALSCESAQPWLLVSELWFQLVGSGHAGSCLSCGIATSAPSLQAAQTACWVSASLRGTPGAVRDGRAQPLSFPFPLSESRSFGAWHLRASWTSSCPAQPGQDPGPPLCNPAGPALCLPFTEVFADVSWVVPRHRGKRMGLGIRKGWVRILA